MIIKVLIWKSFLMTYLKNLKIREMYKITNHSSAIIGGDFHPLVDYCLFASKDGYWSLHNLNKGICITKQIAKAVKKDSWLALRNSCVSWDFFS